MKRYFCTYFDRNYFGRGLALYESLRRHHPDFELWVLCLDDASHRRLTELHLPFIRLITLGDFEHGDEALAAAKSNRSRVEYFFTCTPSLPLYIFRHVPTIGLLTYLDADLYFYSSPEPIFTELAVASIGIIPHRFTPAMKHMEINGIYNVGFLSFRRDVHAMTCLEWWRARCLEWCYNRPDNGRFGDQKYLDDWPARFPGVHVLRHAGANVAVWNLGNHPITVRDGHILIGKDPLIFFHFHGLRRVRRWIYDLNLAFYGIRPPSIVLVRIFAPYIRALDRQERFAPVSATEQAKLDTPRRGSGRRNALRSIWNNLELRNYMMVVRGHWVPLAEFRQLLRR